MIDEHGAGLHSDLLFYFGFDLVDYVRKMITDNANGESQGQDPALVLNLIERLPDDSMTYALAQGGRKFLGWGTERRLQVMTYDALNVNTLISGNWKKGKEPDFEPFPTPYESPTAKGNNKSGKPSSVKELHATWMARRG